MKLTVLVDNNTYIDQYYCGEPAVSYYIEDGDSRILFDTGYSDIFLHNAEKLGVDLKNLTHIIFSHGHNDHTGGLKPFVETVNTSGMTLIAHPDSLTPKRAEGLDVGAPYSQAELAQRMCLHLQKEPCAVTERLLFLGEIPRIHDFEAVTVGERWTGEHWQADDLPDDTALVYRGQEGLFIITGCSHSGICNIVSYAKRLCDEERIAGIIGGFHLFADDERLHSTIRYLEQAQVAQMYPCHCVSLAAKAQMMAVLPVVEVGVGLRLDVE